MPGIQDVLTFNSHEFTRIKREGQTSLFIDKSIQDLSLRRILEIKHQERLLNKITIDTHLASFTKYVLCENGLILPVVGNTTLRVPRLPDFTPAITDDICTMLQQWNTPAYGLVADWRLGIS